MLSSNYMRLIRSALVLGAGICIGSAACYCLYVDKKFGKMGIEVADKVTETVKDGADTVLEEIVKLPEYFYEITKDY